MLTSSWNSPGRPRRRLIVIGLRHRTHVGKFILGGHAQRILMQADRRVLAVKAAVAYF